MTTWEELEREMVSQPVRSLQFMLRRIAVRHSFLPEIIPDGRFGEQTLEAVMLFQKHLHPPVTGVVDQETWTAIRDEWLDVERTLMQPRQLRAFPSDTVVREGDSGNHLYLMQAMFHALSKVLDGVEEGTLDDVHRDNSVRNTRWLQRRAQLRETGEMDVHTWDALSRLYEMMIVSGWDKKRGNDLLPGRG